MASAPTAERDTPLCRESTGAWAGGAQVSESAELQVDERWLCVQRMVRADSFAKASRLSSFLLYIVERALLGRSEEITEQQIGVHVFGRPADYNPGEDNIVRQTARQLRQRLALYYQEEGRGESIQVIVPRGGYTPQFLYVAEHAQATENSVGEAGADRLQVLEPIAVPSPQIELPVNAVHPKRLPKNVLQVLCFVSGGLFIGLAIGALVGSAHVRSQAKPKQKDELWAVLLNPNQRTLIVPGDAGINMYGNLARTQVDAWGYATKSYLSKPEAQTPTGYNWSPFAIRRYTPVSDVRFISALFQLSNADRSKVELRFARDLTAEDLKGSNVILLGSPNYDPWIELFDRNQAFKMVYNGSENSISVQNRSPQRGEKAVYTWSETDPQRTGYAVISLTDNLESTGRVLLVEGTTTDGVESATEFLFHSAQMERVIRDATSSGGKLSNFEVLIETNLYLGGGTKAKVVAERIH